MASHLFSPLTLAGLTLSNRIVVSPMCQYSAVEGMATDWHMMHILQFAISGAAVFMIEASAVESIGRITHGCLGLYTDEQEQALGRIVAAACRYGTARVGIQIGHSGRKGSCRVPWEGGAPLGAEENPWSVVGPSDIPFDEGSPRPVPLDRTGLARIKEAFVASARRADRIGIELVEVHCAHGYLLHSFLSPLSNRRTDEYGGSRDNRMRFPLEVVEAVRAVWPQGKPLGIRVSAVDWAESGIELEDTIAFVSDAKRLGIDYVCVSSGGLVPHVRVPVAPGYQLPFAERIRRETGLITRAVGMIVSPRQAEAAIVAGQADQVAIARAFLDDPRWTWHAAEALGVHVPYPPQYERCRADRWPGAKLAPCRQSPVA